MKKLLTALFFITAFFFSFSTTSAQEKMSLIAPGYPGRDQLTGENHQYSLILKGNGNSVVLGRINFSNQNSTNLSSYDLEFPNGQIENLVAYQEIPRPVCAEYAPSPLSGREPNCLRYQTPIYPDPYNSDYKKLEPTINGNQVVFNLAERVRESSSSGLVFSFSSPKYVEKEWGRYNFSFETPKAKSTIQNLQLSIDTDNRSLYLNVDKEKVNYSAGSEMVETSLASRDAIAKIAPIIGSGGRVYKNATNLTAGETLKVKGAYSESMLFLNLTKILIFFGSLLAVAVLLVLLIKLNVFSKLSAVLASLTQNPKNLVLVEALVALVLSAKVFGAVLLLNHLLSNGGYSSVFPYGMDGALGLMVVLIMGFFVLLLLGLPAVLFGIKFGWRHLVYYLLLQFFWLFVMIVTYALLFMPQGGNSIYPAFSSSPVRVMDGKAEPAALQSTEAVPAPETKGETIVVEDSAPESSLQMETFEALPADLQSN